MFKYTKNTLKKLEELFEAAGYTVRYEKGQFQSGYCLVKNRKIAVINKFFDTEGRINCLLDILAGIPLEEASLQTKAETWLGWRRQQSADTDNQPLT